MFTLSEEHSEIREAARDFARNEILPGAMERDRTHAFPAELINQLAEMGFMGMIIPETYGGSELDTLSYVIALEEIAYADAGVAVRRKAERVVLPRLRWLGTRRRQLLLSRRWLGLAPFARLAKAPRLERLLLLVPFLPPLAVLLGHPGPRGARVR